MDYQTDIKTFIEEVQQMQTDSNLKGLLQYGKMLRVKNYTDNVVNLLFVYDNVSLQTLEALNDLLAKERSIRIEPFILTETEIESSADVYPIKFLDISQNHKLLLGNDPFDKVEVCKDNLRLRCEQELRNIALRLRYSLAKGEGSLMKARMELRNSFYPLINNLEVVIMLKTEQIIKDYDAIIEHAVSDLNFDREVLISINKWINGDHKLNDEAFLDVYQKYREGLYDLIHLIDNH